MSQRKYCAFISYSHVDKAWAKWLHHALESYRKPKHLASAKAGESHLSSRLTPVFRDQEELPSASDLSFKIRESLEHSENLILICSPSAARSKWVDREVQIFKQMGRSDRIFCLIVDGDPTAIDTVQDCFPPSLRDRYDAHGQLLPDKVEPIAADVRKQGDGKSLARTKIIAGMLGLGLDDLRQRESHRKQRQMAFITTVSLAALIVTAILAISAQVARNDADHRRKQAEDLLSYMVGDLRESLTPIGRLDLLENVGEKAMAYFATINASDLSEEELTRHAEVLTQIGEIRVSQHQYDTAVTSFIQAHERSAELARNQPDNSDHLFNRGQAEFWVGYVHWRRGDLESARDWLAKYRNSSQQLLNLDPARDDWAREVIYGNHNLAVLALETDDLDAAQASFQRELQALREMQVRDASDKLKKNISDTISWLGNIAVRKGELDKAVDYYQRTSVIMESLLQNDPDNADHRYGWAYSVQLIAETQALKGGVEQASILVDQAISVFDELKAFDENNKEWLRASTRAWLLKGQLYAAHGVLEKSRTIAADSIILLESLITQEASDLVITRMQLVNAYHLLSLCEQMSGNFTAALEANQKALDHMLSVQDLGRLNNDRLGQFALVIATQGQINAVLGETELANASWTRATSMLEERIHSTRSPFLLDPWFRVLVFSGSEQAANKVLATLKSQGYQPLQRWPDTAH